MEIFIISRKYQRERCNEPRGEIKEEEIMELEDSKAIGEKG